MFNAICNLPDDIIRVIFDFIPKESIKCTNKTNFFSAIIHKFQGEFTRKNVNNYMRHIIRHDLIFPLQFLLKINNHWFKAIKYKFDIVSYPSYIIYLKELSLKNNSQKCYEYIKDINGMRKKKYKKIKRKNSRWSN
tara:strand:- start:7528 stop:7935 length:408 start_codon:yes stop_codon:yes gene_type:complete